MFCGGLLWQWSQVATLPCQSQALLLANAQRAGNVHTALSIKCKTWARVAPTGPHKVRTTRRRRHNQRLKSNPAEQTKEEVGGQHAGEFELLIWWSLNRIQDVHVAFNKNSTTNRIPRLFPATAQLQKRNDRHDCPCYTEVGIWHLEMQRYGALQPITTNHELRSRCNKCALLRLLGTNLLHVANLLRRNLLLQRSDPIRSLSICALSWIHHTTYHYWECSSSELICLDFWMCAPVPTLTGKGGHQSAKSTVRSGVSAGSRFLPILWSIPCTGIRRVWVTSLLLALERLCKLLNQNVSVSILVASDLCMQSCPACRAVPFRTNKKSRAPWSLLAPPERPCRFTCYGFTRLTTFCAHFYKVPFFPCGDPL